MTIKNGTVIAGKFRLEKLISENGGTATVYLGDLVDNPRQKVAIKFAHSSTDGPMQEDMLLDREASLLSRWDWRHPGIVRIYPIPRDNRGCEYSLNAVELPERPRFMVMEYLSGGSMADNLKKIKTYPLGWKLEFFYQLLTAVSHIHQTNYGHRDLKPENIVFRDEISPTTVPVPVLIDFALASNGSEQYAVVESSHTMEYVSPERLLRSMGYENLPPYPTEADVWSLGIILYELITGEHLIKGSENSVRTTIIKGAFSVDLTETQFEIKPEAAEHLTKLIKKMLDPDPKKRANIKQVVLALEALFPPPRIVLS